MKRKFETAKGAISGTTGNAPMPMGIPGRRGMNKAPPAPILDPVGDAWQCRRLPREADRAFAFRLAVHLRTLAIAIEEDLQRVLEAEQSFNPRSKAHGTSSS